MEGSEKREVIYGSKNIPFTLLRMERKTIEISVHPDCSVSVKSPLEAEVEYVDARVKKRARWILRQFNYFKQFQPKASPKYYVGGETHFYLGRRYRLKILEGGQNRVRLKDGVFLIETRGASTPATVKKLMEAWYGEKAQECFMRTFEKCWEQFTSEEVERPKLSIRMMKTRWGSLSDSGTLTLNRSLVKAPKECLEYVVIHELCHLKYANHSSDFYEYLEGKLPDWRNRKHKLELKMAEGSVD